MRIVLLSAVIFAVSSAGPVVKLNGETYTDSEKQKMNDMVHETMNRVVRYFESRNDQVNLNKYSKAEQEFTKDKHLFEILPKEQLYCLNGHYHSLSREEQKAYGDIIRMKQKEVAEEYNGNESKILLVYANFMNGQ
ncbi:hypothetical protein PRIPAC_89753 [Pristionchus pacificus]|uniref:Uncharacterized protein n=1 Tax=Pristionchus pacificus TaxID=54126 RepID=A0A2A6CX18_PRIPA|nr:hypothetical protein PRIPAC_89753 [Pristionchus pacificus]|eukprot:PDM82688.1 hypothetical protein PRIPAC_37081 [Pristionchus pacificus]